MIAQISKVSIITISFINMERLDFLTAIAGVPDEREFSNFDYELKF